MTLASEIAWDDAILPFQLDRADIRGRVARLDASLDTILTQHAYPMPVAGLVAEAVMLTALIGQTIKLRWRLSLQIRGDGPIRLIATDYYGPDEEGAPARIRAFASFDEERLSLKDNPFTQIGRGMFAMVIDQGEGMTPYQGITPLSGGSLSSCAETYFAQSEQLPTRFAIAAGQSSMPGDEAPRWRAGGIMLQHMPAAGVGVATDEASGEDGLLSPTDLVTGEAEENWTRVNLLLDTVEETELLGPHVTTDGLIVRLFHEDVPRAFDAQPIRFGCTCSEIKVRESLSIYSAKDIAHMTREDGTVTADCQFCGAHYSMQPETLGFEATSPES
ncbi:MAG: Hsp33 family molecular chaperone HslO [Pseudomonadota bacterium]